MPVTIKATICLNFDMPETEFCIYEIDTPAGHLTGSRFADGERRVGPLCGTDETPHNLNNMLHLLQQHAETHGYPIDQIFGHFTTNNGIAINAFDLLEAYIECVEICEFLEANDIIPA